ncbi:MAG: hypothetical protein HC938_17170 [Nitrospira sp.]|nr:hypothetical protein [Nitrospira sp.]
MKIIDKDVASASQSRSAYAKELLAAYFQHSNWHVERHISIESGRNRHDADLAIRKGAISYVVEVKAAPEGRADRDRPALGSGMPSGIEACSRERSGAARSRRSA